MLGQIPKRPPRGGDGSAGKVQSRRNRRSTTSVPPMARQMADDARKMSQLSEEVGEWHAQRTNDVAMFTPGCCERVRFLEFPVEELRGAKMAYCFPESEQEETEEIDGRLISSWKNPLSVTKTKGKKSLTKDSRTADGWWRTRRENMASEPCWG